MDMLVESTRARGSELGESGRRVLDILQRRNRNLRRVNEVSQKLTTMPMICAAASTR